MNAFLLDAGDIFLGRAGHRVSWVVRGCSLLCCWTARRTHRASSCSAPTRCNPPIPVMPLGTAEEKEEIRRAELDQLQTFALQPNCASNNAACQHAVHTASPHLLPYPATQLCSQQRAIRLHAIGLSYSKTPLNSYFRRQQT